MNLELDDREHELLRYLLSRQHGDLRMQIADTDTSTYRERLRAEKAVVLGILEKLGVDATTG